MITKATVGGQDPPGWQLLWLSFIQINGRETRSVSADDFDSLFLQILSVGRPFQRYNINGWNKTGDEGGVIVDVINQNNQLCPGG